MFYDSNFDKYFIPKDAGWYVQFKTESGDQGAIKLPKQPINNNHVRLMLKEINPDETYYIQFYKEVK
jgi:hypothetical protein